MNCRRPHFRPVAVLGCLCIAALAGTGALGQDKAGASYDEWRLVEPAQEMQDYKAALRDGSFDEASRKFLLEIALPQLGMRKNRAGIDLVRRRMREVLCGEGGGDPKASASAMQIVTEFMTALARDKKAEIVTRVNAALLVGELRGSGNKPWTPAVVPLVEMVGDDALPAAVRIAAAAGLARHVEADPEARATDVGPKLVALAGSPLAGIDPVAADWLRSRALAMLARMGPAAPNGTGAMAAKMLADAQRPIDVRVRAAAAVGRCVKAPGDTDVAAAVAAIRAVAEAGLAATKAATDRRERVFRLSGNATGQAQAQPGPAPDGGSTGGTTQEYRRDAWRLATLADALATSAGDGGLARFAGAAAATATDVARALREGAAGLDAQPGAKALDAAIQGLAATKAPAAAGDGARAAEKPAAVAAPADGIPFGEK